MIVVFKDKKLIGVGKELVNLANVSLSELSELVNLIEMEIATLKNESIKSIIFDLGYSYTQIKDSKKGLSFDDPGELNMKMGLNDFSANDAINKLDQNDLKKILFTSI